MIDGCKRLLCLCHDIADPAAPLSHAARKAQLRSLDAHIDLARERLAAEEERALRDLDARRDMLATQLAHHQALQNQRLEADRNMPGYQKQLDHWPLAAAAASILGASRRRPVPTLNVIVNVTARGGAAGIEPAVRATRRLDVAARRFFGDDVLLYGEEPLANVPALVPLPNPLWGQSLVSTVNDLLYTEPTALLEISVEDGSIVIDGAFWGWPCEAEAERTVARRTPAPIVLQPDADPARAERQILDTLLLVIAGIQDAFTLLNRWDVRAPLRLFDVLSALALPEAPVWPGGEIPVGELRRLIAMLARSAPALAADAAASAALDARAAGQDGHAAVLLGQALDHARAAIGDAPEGEEALVRRLMAEPPQRRTAIQEALAELRGARPEPLPPPPLRPPLSDLSANANRRLRGEARP